jgi:LuxR family transcriptional regulator/LuxR family quorum-sensing system transcriptional regulator CciR
VGFLPHFYSEDASVEAIWKSFTAIAKSNGFTGSIMLFSPRLRARRLRPVCGGDGFPQELSSAYVERRLYRVDPMLAVGAKRLLPFTWGEIESLGELPWRYRPFVRAVREAGLVDACALPLFGPAGWSGQIVLLSASPLDGTPESQLLLQGIAQTMHNRLWDLGWNGRAKVPELSAREREVLHWITRGKSNAAIAAIFNLSTHTVDTYQRRLYAKLGATDRVSAAVRAISLGLADAEV